MLPPHWPLHSPPPWWQCQLHKKCTPTIGWQHPLTQVFLPPLHVVEHDLLCHLLEAQGLEGLHGPVADSLPLVVLAWLHLLLLALVARALLEPCLQLRRSPKFYLQRLQHRSRTGVSSLWHPLTQGCQVPGVPLHAPVHLLQVLPFRPLLLPPLSLVVPSHLQQLSPSQQQLLLLLLQPPQQLPLQSQVAWVALVGSVGWVVLVGCPNCQLPPVSCLAPTLTQRAAQRLPLG